MPSMLRKVAEYLGLAPDDEYDDYHEAHETHAPRPAAPVAQPPARSQVTAMPVRQAPAEDEPRVAAVRPLPVSAQPQGGSTPPPPSSGGMTRGPSYAQPTTVSPASFGDAQEIADKFKANRPVIMNLEGLERDLSRRLIDFASGLCYGLSGNMKKVANQVFLLTPADVEVPAEERRRLSERGYADS